MLKILTSVTEYLDFVDEMNRDPDFSDPMLSSQEEIQCNLLDAPGKPTNQILGLFEGVKIVGLFVFLVLKEESYMEMLVGLSRNRQAYQEMLSFLKETYKGYQVDFVYNPRNLFLHTLLLSEKTEFEAEQQKMVLKREVPFQSSHKIELYSPKYREQYIAMHDAGGYWTAEKVIEASDRFRIILALEEDTVVGYIDITYKYEENEPFDVFVKEGYRGRGYGKAMLARAIELNRPKGLMLLVDIDNTAAIALYESLGFDRFTGGNNITAHVSL